MAIEIKNAQVSDRSINFHVTRPPQVLFKSHVKQLLTRWKSSFPHEYREFFEFTKQMREVGDPKLKQGVRQFGHIPGRIYHAIGMLVDLKDWSCDPQLMKWFFEECRDAKVADGEGTISTMYDLNTR